MSREPITIDIPLNNEEKGTLTFSFNTSWGNSYFEVHASKNSSKYAMIRIYFEKETNFSNGETFEVTLDPPAQVLAETFGIKITNAVREYTVSGLN